MSSAPPISSLRLLVPPLRLMSAFMWQIAQRQNLEHYGKLEEFVSVVTKLVPEVLTSRQKATLIMGLRAKMILEMCRDEVPADFQTVKSHINSIQSSHSSKGSDPEVESLQANLLKLVLSLLEDPAKKEHFFQEVFPVEYGPDFDKALQVLVGHFLSRLEQLLPVPNFKQTSSLLGACHWELKECVESVCRTESLLPLMQSDICGPLEDNVLPSIVEERIISSLSLPPMMDTVLSSQSSDQPQTQPFLSAESPSHAPQVVEHECEVEDSCEHDEELTSGLDETASSEHPNTLQSPRADEGATEEEAERQNFEIEITEAIKHLEKESKMPTQVAESLPNTEMPEVSAEPKNMEGSESGVSEAPVTEVVNTGQEAKMQIPRIPLTKITLPLELSRSTRDAQNNEVPEEPGSFQDPNSPSAPLSSGNTSLQGSYLLSRRLYKCTECSKRFTYRSELLKHQQTHSSRTAPKCCECGQVFNEAKQLSLHRQKSCKMRTYKCIKCGAGFKSLSNCFRTEPPLWSDMGSPLPFSSLRLLVPPLRLMSAFMWQVVQQQKLEHFNELEEYILLLTKMFPKILSERQKTALIMGLRAKMILETCKGEVPINMETIKEHLQTVESKAAGSEVESLQCKLLKLLISLLEDPVKKEHFFQEVFPLEYGPDFDKALQVLVGHFLSRLEQLLPVPNFKQAALWLSSEPTGWENLVQTDWNPRFLLPLLRSDYQGTLETNGLPSVVEDRIISTLSLPPLTDVAMPRESNTADQSEPSSCLESSSQDVNQDMTQDVSQENKTEALSPKILNLNQIEGHTEIVVEPESSRCGIQEEADVTENDVEESSVYEVEEVTMETSQSESEDVKASAELDRPENEASAEVAGPEPISEISGTSADLRDVDEGGVEAADEAPAISTGPLLKVVVPRHLISVIKQIQLPSVSLSRCMSSESGSLKLGPEVLKTSSSSSSSPSPSSGNGCKTQRKRSQLRRQHQCSECRLSFRCQVELRAHMRRHTEKGPYKCQPCKLNFKTYFQASVHQRKWHSKITYSCAHCDQTFKSMKAWLMHRREHKDKTVHRCTDCGKECITLQSLVNHSKVHNHLSSTSERRTEERRWRNKAPDDALVCCSLSLLLKTSIPSSFSSSTSF
ncbi:hypothetical protein MHYP_G00317090 [Metynnis hypsauchen]